MKIHLKLINLNKVWYLYFFQDLLERTLVVKFETQKINKFHLIFSMKLSEKNILKSVYLNSYLYPRAMRHIDLREIAYENSRIFS